MAYTTTPRRQLIAPTAPQAPTVPSSWQIQPQGYRSPSTSQIGPSTGSLAQMSPVGASTPTKSLSGPQIAPSTSRITAATPAARDVFNPLYAPESYPQPIPFESRAGTEYPQNPLGPKNQLRSEQQRSLLGPLADLLMAPDQLLKRGDIPLLEAGLNFQQLQQAEADRQRGYEELARAYGSVGQDPTSQYLRDAMMQSINSGGPYNPQILEQLESQIRGESALSQEATARSMAEEYARRGLGGGAMPMEQAAYQQTGARDLASQLAQLRQQAALANEAAQQQWTQMLAGQTSQEEQYRQALNQMLANVFLETERAPIDLGSLAIGKNRTK